MTNRNAVRARRARKTKQQLIDEIDCLEGAAAARLDEKNQPDRTPSDDETRWRNFAELSSQWFWEMDADLRFTYMSERVEDILGVPVSFHIGKTRQELAGEDAATKKWRDHFADLAAHRPFRDFSYVRMGPDGHLQYLSTSGNPLFDADGVFRGYVGTGTDLTAQHVAGQQFQQIEHDFKATEERLHSAIEAIDDGFVVYDSEDRFVLSNKRYKELYKASAAFMVPGTRFEDILRHGAAIGQYPEAIGRIDEWIDERLREHREAAATLEQRLDDGTWLRIAERRTESGETVGLRVDITAIKAVQAELEETKRQAEQANIAKSNFLSTMSHEIRTPLNGVLGIAQLLARSDLDDDQRDKVETILSSGQTLLAIINDVLDMSKIEAGGLELESTPFSMSELISTVAVPFESLADEKGLTLEVENRLAAIDVVNGDPVRLRQILWNLLSNAIKFTGDGGATLTIEDVAPAGARAAEVAEIRDHTVRISVADTGAGISPHRLPVIFDAFAQEDNSITRKYGGSGLGLAIVKRLIEMIGGAIKVSSEVGRGTLFEVYLSYAAASAEDTAAVQRRSRPADVHGIGHLNILVAEDNAVNAMIAEAFLRNFGHNVRVVGNGRLAVEAVAEEMPDIILMDIHMPEMDGVQATEKIRASAAGREVPIIGVTAEAFAERHTGFVEAGIDAILTKPYTEDQLVAVLTRFGRVRSPTDSGFRSAGAGLRASPKYSAAPPPTAPIGNEKSLAALQSQVPPAAMFKLLSMAPEGLLARVAEIRGGLEDRDSKMVRMAAHSIKGTSGSLFAVRLSREAAIIESMSTDLDAVGKLIPTFQITVDQTISWWRAMAENVNPG